MDFRLLENKKPVEGLRLKVLVVIIVVTSILYQYGRQFSSGG
nr:MAG TPA: hypothetical protein [Caudoviricetes sp.]